MHILLPLIERKEKEKRVAPRLCVRFLITSLKRGEGGKKGAKEKSGSDPTTVLLTGLKKKRGGESSSICDTAL